MMCVGPRQGVTYDGGHGTSLRGCRAAISLGLVVDTHLRTGANIAWFMVRRRVVFLVDGRVAHGVSRTESCNPWHATS
jgi:hypothetical protein